MGSAESPGRGRRSAAWLLLVTGFFGLAHGQAPLYYSNQNQYFLHGLAAAGRGSLHRDWLANTADPTPVFSTLVAVTARVLHEYAFHGYYLLLFGVYVAAAIGLFSFLARDACSLRLRLAFFSLFLLLHSALVRWVSYRLFGQDYPWYLQAGLAGQYVLGAMFQPSVFGVFLVLSVALFAWHRPYWAVISAVFGASVHSTYLPVAGMLIVGYLVALWREGERRDMMRIAALAMLLGLPALGYALITFRPTSPELFARAQHILTHDRIPHHCQPRLWCDWIAVAQICWMLLGIALTRRTRLFPVLGVTFLLSLALTLVQVATDSNLVALLFPWRASAVLMPIATVVILSRVVVIAARCLDRSTAAVASCAMIIVLAAAGVTLTLFRQGFQSNDDELPLLRHVKENAGEGDTYLLPVLVPDLAKSTRGSLSTDFKPLAAKKTDARVIPVDLQRFRLSTGVPIFVDFKSIPYQDTDVLEWRARLDKNRQYYDAFASGQWHALEEELRDHGITHVVFTADQPMRAANLTKEYDDGSYRVYRLPWAR